MKRKQKGRRAVRRKAHAAVLDNRGPVIKGHLPKNFVEGLASGSAVFKQLAEGKAIPELLEEKEARVSSLLAAFDLPIVLGQVTLMESIQDPDHYKESESPGAAYVVELAAACSLKSVDEVEPPGNMSKQVGEVAAEIRDLTRDAALMEALRRTGRTGSGSDPLATARDKAIFHDLYLRNPGWPWQEQETLRGLFSPTRFDDRLKKVLGFGVEEAICCSEAALYLVRRQLAEQAEKVRGVKFGPGHPAYDWAESSVSDGWKSRPAEAARYIPILWNLEHAGTACLLNAQRLAFEAGVTDGQAASYLRALSVEVGSEQQSNWFDRAEIVRGKPYLKLQTGEYLQTVPGADLWSLRKLFQDALKKGTNFLIHRGDWLEQRVAHLVEKATKPDQLLASVQLKSSGSDPSGEIDVLARFGTALISFEAKSATMRESARRGGEAFISHLEKNLAKAAKQGENTRRAVAQPERFVLPTNTLAQIGKATEVHPVVVTLDDLSAVAPIIWQFEGSKLLPEGVSTPWLITLAELELVLEMVESPIQLIHFLRRRSQLNDFGDRFAEDELDWWMLYLESGLYFDSTPDIPTRYLSLTDPLDAWCLYTHGLRKEPAPKPTMKIPNETRRFLNLLGSERPPGWTVAGCNLLEMSTDSQETLWDGLKEMRPRANSRGKAQRQTMGVSGASGSMLVCTVVVPAVGEKQLQLQLENLVEQRLDEEGIQRVLGIGLSSRSKRPYDALLMLEPKS